MRTSSKAWQRGGTAERAALSTPLHGPSCCQIFRVRNPQETARGQCVGRGHYYCARRARVPKRRKQKQANSRRLTGRPHPPPLPLHKNICYMHTYGDKCDANPGRECVWSALAAKTPNMLLPPCGTQRSVTFWKKTSEERKATQKKVSSSSYGGLETQGTLPNTVSVVCVLHLT